MPRAVLAVPHGVAGLTPTWLTEALARSFPGADVASVRVRDVAGGTNTRCVAELAYARGHGPASVFVKLPGRLLHRLALGALGAWSAEARLAASGIVLPVEAPAFFAGATDPCRLAAAVVMEDVTARGGRPNSGIAPLSPGEVSSGLRELASLHAAHLDRRLPGELGYVRAWRLAAPWAPVSAVSLARGLARWARLAPVEAATLRRAVGVRELERRFRSWAAVARTGPQTLLHGDPHPANTYSLPGGRTGFLDWQLVRVGSYAHDVGYFLAGSLDPATRRRVERDLLAGYLEHLAELGAATPPTLDETWTRYRSSVAFGLGTWLHTIGAGSFQPADVSRATLERFAAAYVELGPV
jgi:hypothetical protein